jgi:Tripartite tricarboxylate transporter TctA family/Protein of unknown function (DUF3592)
MLSPVQKRLQALPYQGDAVCCQPEVTIQDPWEGYRLNRQGQTQYALGLAIMSSAFGGLVSALFLAFFAPPFATLALTFSTVELFAVVVFGLASVAVLGQTSLSTALVSLCVGMFLGTIDTEAQWGIERFTFGVPFLRTGVDFVTVLIGHVVSATREKDEVMMGCLFVIIGILCFLIAVGMGISSLSFSASALRTKGTVIDMAHSGRTSAPIVRYQVDGKSYQIQSSPYQAPPIHTIGEEVTVLYQPAYPHQGQIHSFGAQWRPPLLLGVIGLLFAISGFKRLGARS